MIAWKSKIFDGARNPSGVAPYNKFMSGNQRKNVLLLASAICTIVPGLVLQRHFTREYLYGLVLGVLVTIPVVILIKRHKAN